MRGRLAAIATAFRRAPVFLQRGLVGGPCLCGLRVCCLSYRRELFSLFSQLRPPPASLLRGRGTTTTPFSRWHRLTLPLTHVLSCTCMGPIAEPGWIVRHLPLPATGGLAFPHPHLHYNRARPHTLPYSRAEHLFFSLSFCNGSLCTFPCHESSPGDICNGDAG